MTFKHLGVKPPRYCEGCSFKCQATGCECLCHEYSSSIQTKHFRGALLEVKNETQRLKQAYPNVPLSEREGIKAYYWWCSQMDKLYELLRVSAGVE